MISRTYFEAFDKREHVVEPLEGEEHAVPIFSERPLTKTEKNAILDKQFAGGERSLEEYQSQLKSNQ